MIPKELIEAANVQGVYAVHESAEVVCSALALARGSYQRALIEGRAALSGATLRGAAKKYAGRYSHSAHSLVRRLRAAGLGDEIRAKHGRRVLILYRVPRQLELPFEGVSNELGKILSLVRVG